ncbi:uncharacterized protein LOC144444621 [Glandiceps talaboti]
MDSKIFVIALMLSIVPSPARLGSVMPYESETYIKFEYEGINYEIFLDEVTWPEAYDICKAEGSVLASVKDQQTQDALASFLGNASPMAITGSFWIDATDSEVEGVWKDSAGKELTFTAWAPLEPNDGGSSYDNEDCVHLWWEHDFKWNDNRCQSHIYFICQSGSSSCYTTANGKDYLGTVSTTASGLECQEWSSQEPHRHVNYKPYPLLQDNNYCRNPDGSGDDAWCYTTDPETRWEYCDVGYSHWPCDSDNIECFETSDARDYQGHVSQTRNGKTCQRWDVQYPHEHSYRGDDFLVDHNYCRNPSGANRPWCYTTDPDIRWEYCDVCGEGPMLTNNDIALNKMTSQSSLHHNLGVASHAVDGFKSTFYADESCTHTEIENNAWWKVDLQYTYFVQEVVITNRQDCCSERLEGAVVRVGSNHNIRMNEQCGSTVTSSDASSRTLTFTCESGTVGRYVSVQLEGFEQYLTLCEVEVHGHRAELWRPDGRCGPSYPTISMKDGECNPNSDRACCSPYGWCGISRDHCECSGCIDYREVYTSVPTPEPPTGEVNLALEKVTSQSSLFEVGYASRAVDGFKSTSWIDESCTHTQEDSDPWWRVDLGDTYPIDRVVVTNRKDCCSERLRGAVVRVGSESEMFHVNTQCGRTVKNNRASSGRPITFKCRGATGRYVSVQLEGWTQYLTLCEVEVYQADTDIFETDDGSGEEVDLPAYREDVQCGSGNPAPNGLTAAECNPNGIYPCCSTANWCGISSAHCECYGCVDYREVYEVTDSPVEACSQTKRITIPHGGEVTVTSPAYPDYYPSYADCRWIIETEDSHNVQVTVNDVRLESCCANVYVGEGDSIGTNQQMTLDNWTNVPITMIISSSAAWIHLSTQASQYQRDKGFNITLKDVEHTEPAYREDVQCGSGYPAPNGLRAAECNPNGIYPCCSTAHWCGISSAHCECYGCVDYREVYEVIDSPVEACSQTKRITIPHGGEVTVTSPAYPDYYPSYADCHWIIETEDSHEIEISIDDVGLESCCANVYIGEGDESGVNQQMTLNNWMNIPTRTISSSAVWIHLSTEATGYQRDKGFSITLKDVQHTGALQTSIEACSASNGQRFVLGEGDIALVTSPNYPNEYWTNSNCHWVISASSPNTKLKVEFLSFSTEGCCDEVTIGSGDQKYENEIEDFSGTTVPGPITVESPIWISFVSDSSIQLNGFQIQVTTLQAENEPECISRWSEKSEFGDDVQIEVECEEDEVMTSCNSVTLDERSHGSRDGDRIVQYTSKPKCVAQNGAGGRGVYAVARCCKWSELECYYFDSVWKSGVEDDAVTEAMCENNLNSIPTQPLGCMAHTYWQWLDGARPWSHSSDIESNRQTGFQKNGCVAQNGIYGHGVWAEAACCSAPGLQCQQIYSDRSDGVSFAEATVSCESGWTMTGCSVFTYWGMTDGAYITDGTCKAINGGQGSMGNNTRGVWAVAICCRTSTE